MKSATCAGPIVGRDDVFPRAMATLMQAQAPKFGFGVVYQAMYPVGTLDHPASRRPT